jgi:hypothetical protein
VSSLDGGTELQFNIQRLATVLQYGLNYCSFHFKTNTGNQQTLIHVFFSFPLLQAIEHVNGDIYMPHNALAVRA